ncbi:MAG: hypothetical protein RSF70_02425 [Ruthenibacterium sp.]
MKHSDASSAFLEDALGAAVVVRQVYHQTKVYEKTALIKQNQEIMPRHP